MQSYVSKTKLIWSLSQASFERSEPAAIARLLISHRLDAVRATFTESLNSHLQQLRQSITDELCKDKRIATPQGACPFLLSLAGRQAKLRVPAGKLDVADKQIVDVSFKCDFEAAVLVNFHSHSGSFLEILVTSADMLSTLVEGSTLSLSYGQTELKIVSLTRDNSGIIHAKACVNGGATLLSGMDVHSAHMSRDLFPLVSQDTLALETRFGGLADYVIVHGVKSEEELLSLKGVLMPHAKGAYSRRHPTTPTGPTVYDPNAQIPPRFLLKIDSKVTLDLLPLLLHHVDGVFLSRSELGLTVEPNSLPLIQKELIATCNQAAKVVVVASELMYSMRTNPNPTRAEVSDMANAAADGADALVLSEEVTEGPHFELVAEVSKETLSSSEPSAEGNWERVPFAVANDDDAIAQGALSVARHCKVRAIVCLTEGGYTAFRLSTLRTPADIIAVTYNHGIMRQLNLLRSVVCLTMQKSTAFDHILSETKAMLCKHHDFARGDKFVFVTLTASSVAARNSNLFTVQEID